MNILFRADSSSLIGMGHIMRDLVLANQYPKANIVFATQELDGNINYKIDEAGFKIELLKSNDIKEIDKLIKKLHINLLIIDHYDIDYIQEKELKTQNISLKILSFDDMYKRHYCDILLNHNINADEKRYEKLVPKGCEIRCGSKFTLIRDEFLKAKERKKKRIKQNKKLIFIAMGGSDHANIVLDILKSISCMYKINIVTTSSNKNLKKIQKYVSNKKYIKLHIDSNNIANIMNQCDFAIISPSVISHEVIYMGLPFVSILTGKDQIEIYNYFKNNKLITMERFNRKKLQKSILRLSKNLKNYKLKLEKVKND